MRSVALSVALLAVLGLLAAPAAATVPFGGAAQTDAPSTPGSLAGGSIEEPSTTMDIRLQPDRSAEWDVTVTYRLDSDSERAAFDAFATTYESGSAAGGPNVALYRNIAATVSEQTGREMTIENVAYSATRSGETGRLHLSFTWTGFLEATTEGETEQLVFSDVFRTQTGDSWLGSLGANQTLRIHTPRGYAITSANVAFADNTVVIEGPRTFEADEQIRIRYEESVFGAGSARFLGIAVIIASMIVGAAVLLRRTDSVHVRNTVLPSGDTETEGADVDTDGDPPQSPESTPEPEDLSLLADDERVERLLERNGGRMRQADIVDETNWSDAKVSQLLSSMADDDQISKLRIGRENLITLPGVDAADGGSGATDDSDDSADDTTDTDSEADDAGGSARD